jgi:hypothetical protein
MWRRDDRLLWGYLLALLAANLSLLLPEAAALRSLGALLLIGLLPGSSWAYYFFSSLTPLTQWTLAAALSYSFTCLATLLLHYLPGPISQWQILASLDVLALLPILVQFITRTRPQEAETESKSNSAMLPSLFAPLLLILLVSLFLRAANLHYSEFQGDEALAMISAAEALEGHEDALFLRSKGPAEVLLPMALWRLTGVINEFMARLPFTAAAVMAIITIYLIGQTISGPPVDWLAAGFFALNGFMVAFGRIVQYQALVVWLSSMAFLSILQWRTCQQKRYALLGGLFLGIGLLAHYDAILVLPAIGWLLIPAGLSKLRTGGITLKAALPLFANPIKAALLFLAAFLAASLWFYLPYALDPQANRTGAYVGTRIGNELRNNLPDFFHFNTFYSSTYYIILTGLLILGLLAWLIWQARRSYWLGSLLAVAFILAALFAPDLLDMSGSAINLNFLPFALIFVAAFLRLPFAVPLQALLLWLAAPFLGYNFIVALGLTHIYTIVPAWSLLAAVGWQQLIDTPIRSLASQQPIWLSRSILGMGFVLSIIFLWNAFVRHDVEYWQDYPKGNLWFYWDPYQQPPKAGFFGFAHRAGWKAIGQKISIGTLEGDYGSNEEPDVTTWYTRGAPRACDPQPEFYFLADDLIDPISIPANIIAAQYEKVGGISLPNQKGLQIMQRLPSRLELGLLDEARLAGEFDQSAKPAAFARSARGSQPVQANFGNLVQLVGYDLNTQRAYPGGRIPVTLYWQTLAPISRSYQIFTHLEGEAGPVAQADGIPVCWSYPTDLWRPGQIIADQHAILLSPDIASRQYPLKVGFYLPDTFERLDVLDIAGNPAGGSVTLTHIEIKDVRE